jgi:VanZ family protein
MWSKLPRAVWRALFWAQWLAVTVLMLVPRPPSGLDTGWDKLNHLLAFAGPCLAGLAALQRPGWRQAAGLMLALLAWGGVLELLQGLLPPRSADAADLLADALGILLGALLYAGAARRFGLGGG